MEKKKTKVVSLKKKETMVKISKREAENNLPQICLDYLDAKEHRDYWQKRMDELKEAGFRLLDALVGKDIPQLVAFEVDGEPYKFGRILYGDDWDVDLEKASKYLNPEQLDAVTKRTLDKKRWEQAVENGVIPKEVAKKVITKKKPSLRVYAKKLKMEEKEENLAPVLELKPKGRK